MEIVIVIKQLHDKNEKMIINFFRICLSERETRSDDH